MAEAQKEFGVVGLGNIGGNLTEQALEKGCRVVGYDKQEAPRELIDAGMVSIPEVSGFRQKLSRPRAIFLYVPAGPVVDTVLGDLEPRLDEGDVVVDGGNSYWGDSIRRYERLKERGIHLSTSVRAADCLAPGRSVLHGWRGAGGGRACGADPRRARR